MDAFISARVPVEVKEQGNAALKRIGATPTQLVNAAYNYVLRTGRLPLMNSDNNGAAPAVRTLTPEQRDTIRSRIARTTFNVPESAWGGDDTDYRKLIAAGKKADYEALS